VPENAWAQFQKTAPHISPEASDNKKRLAERDILPTVLFIDRPNFALILAPPLPRKALNRRTFELP
jgi:hypothetical protein